MCVCMWLTLREVDWFSLSSVVGLLCFAPFIVFYFVMACDQYQCSVSQPLFQLLQGETTLSSIWTRTASFTWTAAKIYAVWVAFQVNSRCMTEKKGRVGSCRTWGSYRLCFPLGVPVYVCS